jgi:hypothetical protein
MSRRFIRISSLVVMLFILSCNANQSAATGSISATESNVSAHALFLPLVTRSQCPDYRASLSAATNKDHFAEGEQIIVTATLLNAGCSNIGLIYYQLQPQTLEHVEPSRPAGVQHYVALDPNSSDTVEFVLTAASVGQTSLSVRSGFEVTLETRPGLLGSAESPEITLTIISP